uniref:Uncharacterized protein n=1 Tax=Ditylenchus dipsaci TaxID=166011 RepID=A0A915CZ74_9BILA
MRLLCLIMLSFMFIKLSACFAADKTNSELPEKLSSFTFDLLKTTELNALSAQCCPFFKTDTKKLFEKLKELRSALKRKFSNLRRNHFHLEVLKMNVSIYSGEVVRLILPKITYKILSSHTIKLLSSGGSVSIEGFYKSSYRTIRKGSFKMLTSGFDMDIILTKDAQQNLAVSDCAPVLDFVQVTLSPPLIEDVEKMLERRFSTDICTSICHTVNQFLT